MKYLGETIDIHSGGIDHIPINHEKEIAQSESATGKPFVRYWVHMAFLVGLEGAKVSKSAGKVLVLEDLIAAGIHPLAFRLFCLGAKYRSELSFSEAAVAGVERSQLEYFNNFAAALADETSGEDSEWVTAFDDRFLQAINNDLNTPQALAVALELVAEANRRADKRIWNTLKKFDRILGLDLEGVRAEARKPPPEAVSDLSEQREQARPEKNFKHADGIRAEP